MKLTVKLPAVVVGAILFTAIASGVVSIVIGRNVLRQEALDESFHRVESYASAVTYYVGSARSLLATTAGSPSLVTGVAHREVAARVLAHSGAFEYVMFLATDGTVAMLEPRALEERLSHRDLAFNTWFGEVRRTNRMVVSDLHISPATQRPTIVIATPVHAADGRTLGFWAGALKLGELSAIGSAGSDGSAPGGWGYVTDRRGLIIAHQSNRNYVENQTDFSTVPSVVAALAGKEGSGEFFNLMENESKLTAYRPLPDLHWAVVYGIPTGTALAPVDALTRGVLLASLVLAALIGAGVFVWTRRTVAPLARLMAAAQTIGTGDFSQRLEAPGRDEIGQLAETFNRMADALTEKDAQVRSRAEELARSNSELEQFAYITSHDLQEPLRMVVSYLQLIERRYKGRLDADADEFIGFAVDGALRMRQLINDVLDYSRVGTRGKPFEPVDCNAVVGTVLNSLKPAIEQSAARISCGLLPQLTADPVQMAQLFQNLIGNAVKFHGENAPTIHIEARQNSSDWKFSIRDDGIGIAPEHIARLFGIFQRLHTRREYPGTGIGLAICKKIVERHHGRIWVESEPGKGSTFNFTIPVQGAIET